MIIFTFMLNLLVCLADESPVPSFATQFSASLTRYTTETTEDNLVVTNRVIKLNAPSAAYVSVVTNQEATKGLGSVWSDGEYILINHPETEDLVPEKLTGHVLFSLTKRTLDGTEQTYCSYTTNINLGSQYQPPDLFPQHWSDNSTITISSWFNFPAPMVDDGLQTSQGRDVHAWYSQNKCHVFGANEVACRVIFTDPLNFNLPVFHQIAYQKEGTFEYSWVVVEDWNSYDESAPAVSAPGDWLLRCFNRENGFLVDPVRAIVSTPTKSDSFKISLSASPVAALGSVFVRFSVLPTTCTDCFQLFESPNAEAPIEYLEFTVDDYDKPKTVFVKYIKAGEGFFTPVAEGGSYGIGNWENGAYDTKTVGHAIRVLTCEGTVGYGCN
eukprot:TRINITY_DN626_c0_g1_i1.p1 TRINITY_DN626_c0_g1~~TRINITY_DN626_c0_g1_i1.p1  ORF type:complete len:384 (+),score=56.06 TRINITY_DN626_c0_g1_i1:72-1223(+)